MANDFVQTMIDASADAVSLSQFMFYPANAMVARRLATDIHTLQYYVEQLDRVDSDFSNAVDEASSVANQALASANAAISSAESLVDDVTNQASQSVQNAIAGVAIDANLVTDALTTISPITNTSTARTQLDKNRESISALDFFTLEELTAYRASTTTFDAYRPLQSFLDYIRDNNVGTAHFEGEFSTSKGLTYLTTTVNPKTRTIMGTLTLNELGTENKHSLLHIAAGTKFSWFGSINIVGVGDIRWSSRKSENALILGGTLNSRDTFIERINISGGFKAHGVLLDNLSTGSNIGDIRVTRCGSGLLNITHSDTTTGVHIYSNTSPGYTQQSKIQVAKLPDVTPLSGFMVSIGDELYSATIDTTSENTLNIFPYLNPIHTDTLPRIYYVYGGGVAVRGGDSSVVKIGKITGTGCGVVYHSAALYPANTGSVTAEGNSIAIVLGGYSVSQAHLGGSIGTVYCEDNVYDIVRRTTAAMSFSINGEYALNLDKVVDLSARRIPGGFASDSEGFKGIPLVHKGYPLSWEAYGGAAISSAHTIDVTDKVRAPYIIRSRNANFLLAIPDKNLNRLFGYNYKEAIVTDFIAGRAPTGTITFTPPAGYTINGVSSPTTFSGFKGNTARFIVRYDYTDNTFIVDCLNLAPRTSTFAVDAPQTIEPNARYTVTVPFTGATSSKFYVAKYSTGSKGCLLNTEYSAPNVIKVDFYNPTANAITLPAGTVSVLEVN